VLEGIIVTLVVGGAVAYLAWSFFPHRRKSPAACAACTHADSRPAPAPVRPPETH